MDIIPIVEEGIASIQDSKQRVVGVYYASELPYCMRKTYYNYFEKAKLNYSLRKVFRIGIALHSLIQEGLEFYQKNHTDFKVLNEPEDVERIFKHTYTDTIEDGSEIEHQFEIHGRPDTIIVDPQGAMHIIEIKSHANVFFLRGAPEEHHLLQLNYYQHFYPESIGHMLYINKAKKNYKFDVKVIDGTKVDNYKEFVEFQPLRYDDGLFKMMVKRAEEVHSSIISETLPMPEAYMRGATTDWECTNCSFKQKCYSEIMTKKGGIEYTNLEKAIS